VTTPSHAFWSGKRVFLTGHTGFKGSWFSIWLQLLGAEVTAVGLPPRTDPALFKLAGVDKLCRSHFCDVRNASQLKSVVETAKPQVVFHLAAQSLVRAGYRDPLGTYGCNVTGTANLLDALRGVASVRIAVMVTTDKVYHNRERALAYREDDALGGRDPYSASKAASEIVINSYREAFLAEQGVAVAAARTGNVIGGGDWSEDRLIPDAVRAWQAGLALDIRRPEAVRPWQHVLDPLAAYMILAERLWEAPELSGAYNFGPEPDSAATVRDVIELARASYEGTRVNYGGGDKGPHEAGLLALDIEKARNFLGVTPRWGLSESISKAMSWYRSQQAGADARGLCLSDIANYTGVL
jgi:CDP-glucose 4,6-dehydratase